MDILEDPVFKTNYHKHKLRVKLWESDFTEKHGRKPGKNDIRQADIKIKESYKMYWKLKTRALEETLMDITFNDDVQDNVANKSPEKVTVEVPKEEKKSIVESKQKDMENIDPHPDQNVNAIKSTTEVDYKNVKGVWGDHLTKANVEVQQKRRSRLVGRSSSFQLSQNKFTNSTLTKRNPRKSLSVSKLKSKSEKDLANDESIKVQKEVQNKDGLDTNKEAKLMFGETLKVIYAEAKPVSQSINTVQNLMEGHTVTRNLNPGWLDRCAKQNNLEYPGLTSQRFSSTSDSGLESMESSVQSPKEIISAPVPSQFAQISDEEDFVCNSDSEEERKKKRIINFKKILNDLDANPRKRLCIDDGSRSSASQLLPCTTDVQTDHSVAINDVSNEPVKQNLNHFNISTNTNNVVESSTNLSNTTSKYDEQGENAEKNNVDSTNSKEKPRRQRARRRIKSVSSDNSDVEFNECIEKPKKTKTTRSRMTRKSKDAEDETNSTNSRAPKTSKKTITEEDDNKDVIQKTDVKAKKTRNTKKSSQRKKKENDEKEVVVPGTNVRIRKSVKTRKSTQKKKTEEDEEVDHTGLEPAERKEPEMYGIETLKAVPRFTMRSNNVGDLIEQFAKSVSCTTENLEDDPSVSKNTKGKLTDKEKLEKKMTDGRINENFVRINLKKKVFVRGKKNFNFSKFKKNQWKQRKKELGASEGSLDVADFMENKGASKSCFKCGGVGHFSRYCTAANGDVLIPLAEMDDSSQFPTLEEAQIMASQNAVVAHGNRIERLPQKPSYAANTETESTETKLIKESDNEDLWEAIEDEEILCGHKIPEELVSKLLPPEIGVVEPLYKTGVNQSLIETPAEVFKTLQMFGHEKFRAGQEKAVMRILSGQSTLVTLSTGSGKSLCYQLPAYLYSKHSNCITLVISPLVSLMDDQVTGVPTFLSAACLHTSQTPKVRENVMQMVKEGKLDILLVSPEAVVAGEKSTGFGALLRQLPPIAFACIDEAHCISQWSHNFRPSYLMVCRVLKEKLGVKTVLALTATSTKTTSESIVKHLDIHDGMAGVISDIPMPRNLILTVSKDDNRDQALITLLRSKRFEECNSVIVYCTRREECTRIAGLLRVSLQDLFSSEKPNSKLSCISEAYHAGLSSHRRKVVQKAFMSGKTRIVVATVAFGMGLNKPDIRAVIHYNMPGTFEGYVQEVGRAGRDGIRAHCHLFLSTTEDIDKWELRRHIFANGVDRHTIRRLLQKVFVPCACPKLGKKDIVRRCSGHEVAIPVDETVEALDITEESISTLLCYLELHSKRFITVLSSVYVRARISSYNGPQALKRAAQSSPPLAMAIALDLKKGISHAKSNIIEFPVVDVAAAIGWDSGVVKSHLKNLEWKKGDGASKRSDISVRYDILGLRVRAPGDLSDTELDEALDALVSRAQSQESSALTQLETISQSLHKFSVKYVKECLELNEEVTNRSDQLKDVIRNYFQGETVAEIDLKEMEKVVNEGEVVSDVRSLILSYRDNHFTGRAVARIFHGIQSPNYPAYVWGKCRFWRAHLSCNFNALCQIATREILALR